MAKIHLLNCGDGDCTIIRHGSGRYTMIDICGANAPRKSEQAVKEELIYAADKPRGNFAMCGHPTNPLDYLEKNNIKDIWRFILTHPDMDHMDGFDKLLNQINLTVFWDSGARKDKPDFVGQNRYLEADWDRMVSVRDGDESGIQSLSVKEGQKFQYANRGGGGSIEGSDYTFIASPDETIISLSNEDQEFNKASYIIVYRSAGGKIVIPGDAQSTAWNIAIKNHEELLENVGFLLAPHHGRKDEDRDWKFLDHLKPKFSLLGCAKSEHLAYDAWSNRGLDYVTQNQCGNMVIEPHDQGLDIYIQNDVYAEKYGGDTSKVNNQGYFYLTTVPS